MSAARHMDDAVIRMENASAAYGRHVAMRDVSIDIRRGDFLGVIGPNGAGKTTLLTVVNGLGQLVGGRVTALGCEVTPASAGELRRRIGYVAQQQDIDPLLPISVRESILVGCMGRVGLLRRIPRQARERTEELMALVGLDALADRPLGHLSGGERQRVAIARALLQEPEILLLDEPTAALDWQAQREILALIQSIHQRFALTSLIVTHDLNTIPDIANRIAFMKAGRLMWEGPADHAVDEQRLSVLYGTQIRVADFNGRRHVCY
ncbi:ABC-type Mn2+/Zn2+ transport system ATPase subunit [Desulfobaculum xiamenense]|uniref:ABC-type Mn2+/Zn2+ transport system ATPase subunit n=1 Tax=Desulfobaculum xiamenense TaxID=995050 RepID=A0A846QCZ7_9BACT|nr:metal ABC transporter ATP-binding protein [Desulfobaculum xiamenense]NJB66596.1 ABC-type Mn2+/Zn2+ transport system ATPase subunit [Desulfobaculum xiamenense]